MPTTVSISSTSSRASVSGVAPWSGLDSSIGWMIVQERASAGERSWPGALDPADHHVPECEQEVEQEEETAHPEQVEPPRGAQQVMVDVAERRLPRADDDDLVLIGIGCFPATSHHGLSDAAAA